MTFGEKLKAARNAKRLTQKGLASLIGAAHNSISNWENDQNKPDPDTIQSLCWALDVTPNYFFLENDSQLNRTSSRDFPPPTVVSGNDVVTFHPIGTVAAGYDYTAQEDLSGDPIDIPVTALRGRPKSDYFVLQVHGDSMYPLYHSGDHILVLRQTTLNRSGDIGVVLYNGDEATLKKVEYVTGEDWMRLVPLNPEYQPKLIEGTDLEQCRILGIPRLLIREIQ